MGKSEILMLLAGVALSIMLALVVVPIFGKSDEFIFKKTIELEVLSLQNQMKIIGLEQGLSLENNWLVLNETNIEGFEYDKEEDEFLSPNIKGLRYYLFTMTFDSSNMYFNEDRPRLVSAVGAWSKEEYIDTFDFKTMESLKGRICPVYGEVAKNMVWIGGFECYQFLD